jgi:hypothetical protein
MPGMDIDKIRSMMNFAIEAIGRGQFDLYSSVYDRDDFGREFRLYAGLEAGAKHFHDEFVDSQRQFVREAFDALGIEPDLGTSPKSALISSRD